jgi:hypothetical protein
MLELSVSPRALTADLSQFQPRRDETVEAPRGEDLSSDLSAEEMEDPLLELLRVGSTLQPDDFLVELRRQRSGESVTT